MTPVNTPIRMGIVFGTRPEVIKLYPILVALEPYVKSGRVVVRTVSTGQHESLLEQALCLFGIQPNYSFELMRDGLSLSGLHASMVQSLSTVLNDEKFDHVLVQGDTLTAFSAALAAFYARIPTSHVEAGLRTWDPAHPFPEEIHRRWITLVATHHFCPTTSARQNLLREGVAANHAIVVGNTVIDAMRLVQDRVQSAADLPPALGQRLFVTTHRRENLPKLEEEILPAIRAVVEARPTLDVVVSVHPNPLVQQAVQRQLGGHPRIHLMRPLDYTESLALVRDVTLVVTDSGGLQEEATALGTPVMVLRRVTERIEALDAGCALLVGTDAVEIATRIGHVLDDDVVRERMAHPSKVFGDGHAAERIVSHLIGEIV